MSSTPGRSEVRPLDPPCAWRERPYLTLILHRSSICKCLRVGAGMRGVVIIMLAASLPFVFCRRVGRARGAQYSPSKVLTLHNTCGAWHGTVRAL